MKKPRIYVQLHADDAGPLRLYVRHIPGHEGISGWRAPYDVLVLDQIDVHMSRAQMQALFDTLKTFLATPSTAPDTLQDAPLESEASQLPVVDPKDKA